MIVEWRANVISHNVDVPIDIQLIKIVGQSGQDTEFSVLIDQMITKPRPLLKSIVIEGFTPQWHELKRLLVHLSYKVCLRLSSGDFGIVSVLEHLSALQFTGSDYQNHLELVSSLVSYNIPEIITILPRTDFYSYITFQTGKYIVFCDIGVLTLKHVMVMKSLFNRVSWVSLRGDMAFDNSETLTVLINHFDQNNTCLEIANVSPKLGRDLLTAITLPQLQVLKVFGLNFDGNMITFLSRHPNLTAISSLHLKSHDNVEQLISICSVMTHLEKLQIRSELCLHEMLSKMAPIFDRNPDLVDFELACAMCLRDARVLTQFISQHPRLQRLHVPIGKLTHELVTTITNHESLTDLFLYVVDRSISSTMERNKHNRNMKAETLVQKLLHQ